MARDIKTVRLAIKTPRFVAKNKNTVQLAIKSPRFVARQIEIL